MALIRHMRYTQRTQRTRTLSLCVRVKGVYILSCLCVLANGLYMELFALQRRIQAMEMRCYHKTLYISFKDHVTNEEVRAKISRQSDNTKTS